MSSVVSRAPRSSFGISSSVRYSPELHEPQGRVPFLRRDRCQWVHGSWSPIVSKVSIASANTVQTFNAYCQDLPLDIRAVCRQKFSKFYLTPTPRLSRFEVQLLSYTGGGQPTWAKHSEGNCIAIHVLCIKQQLHFKERCLMAFDMCVGLPQT
jgi:hypothetical protein